MKRKTWHGVVTFPLYINRVQFNPINECGKITSFIDKTVINQVELDKAIDKTIEEDGYTDVVTINGSTELRHILLMN